MYYSHIAARDLARAIQQDRLTEAEQFRRTRRIRQTKTRRSTARNGGAEPVPFPASASAPSVASGDAA